MYMRFATQSNESNQRTFMEELEHMIMYQTQVLLYTFFYSRGKKGVHA
jgi:hypothetical protein